MSCLAYIIFFWYNHIMKKNDVVEVIIDDIGSSGEGIAHVENFTVFVPFTLPQEKCEIHVLKVKDNLAWAKLLRVIDKNPNRVEPKCAYYGKCGGCVIEHASAECELKFKEQKIITAFRKNAAKNLESVTMFDSDKEYFYRNKCAFPVRNIDGVSKVCMFRGNSHNPIAIESCALADKNINKVISIFNDYINNNSISAFNEETQTGLVKFLVVRVVNNVPLITIVINGDKIKNINYFIDKIAIEFEKFGLNLNINKQNNNIILSNKFQYVYGEKELVSCEYGITYPVSSLSFLQINDYIKNLIYTKVLDLIEKDDIVIDAYSGAGLLSAILAKKAKMVYGIEIIKEATKNANDLAKNNNISNLENINGDCAEKLPKLIDNIKNNLVKVVLDPPRKGCDKKVLDAIVKAGSNTIIYISCNPLTLARDAKILFDCGYELADISGFNMFPQTEHVETLAVFQKR